MARFEIGRPVKGTESRMTVDAGLPVGRHRFQLQVVTRDGRKSVPDVVEVLIEKTGLRLPGDQPTLRPVRPDRNPAVVNPNLTNRVTDSRPPATAKTRSNK